MLLTAQVHTAIETNVFRQIFVSDDVNYSSVESVSGQNYVLHKEINL
jgi:hypothetical protein